MKKALVVLMGAVFALSLCCCSSSPAMPDEEGSNPPVKPLEIIEHDWWISEDGRLSYVARIRNPNESLACLSPCLHILVQHYDWNKPQDNLDVPLVVEPQHVVVLTGSWYSDGHGVASVDFVLDDSDTWEEIAPFSEDIYTLSNIKIHEMLFDAEVSGELLCADTAPVEGVGAVRIAVIFRDSGGKIVGVATTCVDSPPTGEPVTFEAPLKVRGSSGDEPYTYEAYAMPGPPLNA